jgi:hypothetical protein
MKFGFTAFSFPPRFEANVKSDGARTPDLVRFSNTFQTRALCSRIETLWQFRFAIGGLGKCEGTFLDCGRAGAVGGRV